MRIYDENDVNTHFICLTNVGTTTPNLMVYHSRAALESAPQEPLPVAAT